MINWNNKVKRLLKSELIKRGISNTDLAFMLKEIGVEETKASIDSKISREVLVLHFFYNVFLLLDVIKLKLKILNSI